MKKINKKYILAGGIFVFALAIIGGVVYYKTDKVPFECNEKSAEFASEKITELAEKTSILTGKTSYVWKLKNPKTIRDWSHKKVCLAKTNIGGNFDYIHYDLEKTDDGQVSVSFNMALDEMNNFLRHNIIEKNKEILEHFCN